MIEMRKLGMQAQTVPSKVLVMQDNEKQRLQDKYRADFTSILAIQLCKSSVQHVISQYWMRGFQMPAM
jgi:hypothetical protein